MKAEHLSMLSLAFPKRPPNGGHMVPRAEALLAKAGLDVLEEVLTAIGSRARAAMATDGVIGALARLLTRKVLLATRPC